MISVWEAGIDEREPRSLKKDQSCQVLILGGNLAGLFAALFCMEKGYQVIVIEEGVLEERALEISFFDKILFASSFNKSSLVDVIQCFISFILIGFSAIS